jgi:hypothetical protein
LAAPDVQDLRARLEVGGVLDGSDSCCGMRISVASLCDFAQMREGLLFISSGGISRINRPSFPAPMGVYLAITIELTAAEITEPFEVRLVIEDEDGGKVAQIAAGLDVHLGETDPGEAHQCHLPVNLTPVPLPREGRYMIKMSIPEFEVSESLSLRAVLQQA